MEKPDSYDGIYFLPGKEDSELIISYFDFKDEMAGGVPQESTSIGDKWHIAFFKKNDQGDPTFDDSFEGIFACPATYINNLVGAKVYGCMVRKTNKSDKWFDDYLKRTLTKLTINKLKIYAESIANT
jgi:hypothetical protein